MSNSRQRSIFLTILPLLIASLPTCLYAFKDFSDDLAEIARRHKIPGIASIAVTDSGITASGVAGMRKNGGREKITLDDKFHIGSNTKAMTATLCAMLVEDGKLHWDTTIGDVSPTLKRKMLPQFHAITLERLLTHRTGIRTEVLGDPQAMQRLDTFQERFPSPPMTARQRCAEFLVSQSPATTQDGFIYSNGNYVLLSHMIEQALGVAFEQAMRDRLFKPLNMKSAGFGAPENEAQNGQPLGHTDDGQPIESNSKEADNPQIYAGSGTVHCSLIDWAKFVQFHLTKGKSHPELVHSQAISLLHMPKKSKTNPEEFATIAPGSLGYAMGWFVFPDGTLTHSGTNLRWYSQAVIIPKHNIALLVACNQGGDGAAKACLETIQFHIRAQIGR